MIRKYNSQELISNSAYVKRILSKKKIEKILDEKLMERLVPNQGNRKRATKALMDMNKGNELNQAAIANIEAIVLPNARPVYDIVNDTYEIIVDEDWKLLNTKKNKKILEAAIPSVGRIEVPSNLILPFAGTGFLVAKDIVMTNRHVAEVFAQGLGKKGIRFKPGISAGIDFKEEIHTSTIEDVYFDFIEVIMIHPYWDMALFRVTVPESYKDKSPLKLSTKNIQEYVDNDIVVIGYPAMDPRNDYNIQNNIFGNKYNIKRLQPGVCRNLENIYSFSNQVTAVTHDASTLGGNSGSAVIDITSGEVIGLHFAGEYLRANYAVPIGELAKDSYVQDYNLNFSGAASSSDYFWHPTWVKADRLDEDKADMDDVSNKALAANQKIKGGAKLLHCEATITEEGKLAVTIPVEFTVSTAASGPDKGNTASDADEGFIGNYEEREGYDEKFLGQFVPLPWLLDEQYDKVERNVSAVENRHVLTYTNFSIVMNRERRLAFYTAVNIDGAKKGKIPKKNGVSHSWYYDKRISKEAQLNNDFYKNFNGLENPLDRGHLVRRIEPTWGSRTNVIKAHNDTFHWTNCSPQHSNFNKQGHIWADIENFMFDEAIAKELKISVFSGPVFSSVDPIYMAPTGVQFRVPVEFWKILVYNSEDGELRAKAFLLSQQRQIMNLTEAYSYDAYNVHEIPMLDLENKIGILFEKKIEDINFDLKLYEVISNVESTNPNRALSNLKAISF